MPREVDVNDEHATPATFWFKSMDDLNRFCSALSDGWGEGYVEIEREGAHDFLIVMCDECEHGFTSSCPEGCN
jgi:hypothetical protein